MFMLRTLLPTPARALARVERAPLHLPTEEPTDDQLVSMWLHGKAPLTQLAYRSDVSRFLEFVRKPLHQVALPDLQAFADALADAGYAPNTRARALAAIKSLFTFGHKLGYLAFDVGRPVKIPPRKNTLGERILDEGEVQVLIRAERHHPRNHALLRLLYIAGLRVSEAAGLKWRDLVPRGEAGQVTAFGKGGKTRMVLLSESMWRELQALRGTARAHQPVFPSRCRGGHLHARPSDSSARYLADR
jgi:integrase/recombinase XerD